MRHHNNFILSQDKFFLFLLDGKSQMEDTLSLIDLVDDLRLTRLLLRLFLEPFLDSMTSTKTKITIWTLQTLQSLCNRYLFTTFFGFSGLMKAPDTVLKQVPADQNLGTHCFSYFYSINRYWLQIYAALYISNKKTGTCNY